MGGVDTASDWIGVLLAFWVISCLVLCLVVGYLAGKKNRDQAGWALAGFFFGWIALLVIVLLPEQAKVPTGMRSVVCPRCNAKQNVPGDSPSYECWQCKLAVTSN